MPSHIISYVFTWAYRLEMTVNSNIGWVEIFLSDRLPSWAGRHQCTMLHWLGLHCQSARLLSLWKCKHKQHNMYIQSVSLLSISNKTNYCDVINDKWTWGYHLIWYIIIFRRTTYQSISAEYLILPTSSGWLPLRRSVLNSFHSSREPSKIHIQDQITDKYNFEREDT